MHLKGFVGSDKNPFGIRQDMTRRLEGIIDQEVTEGVSSERAARALGYLEQMYPELVTTVTPHLFRVAIEDAKTNGKYLCITYNSSFLKENEELFLRMPMNICSCPIGFKKAMN